MEYEKARALSPSDIFHIAGKTCNVLRYPELSKFNDINEIFEAGSSLYGQILPQYPFDDNTCILLYMTRPNFGHWCTINRYPSGRLDFLDPYGDLVDDQLEYINKKFKKESHQDKAYLCKLLQKSENVHYNDKQIQKLDNETATCGRYAALFLKYNTLHVEQLVNALIQASKKHKISIDDLVTSMTS